MHASKIRWRFWCYLVCMAINPTNWRSSCKKSLSLVQITAPYYRKLSSTWRAKLSAKCHHRALGGFLKDLDLRPLTRTGSQINRLGIAVGSQCQEQKSALTDLQQSLLLRWGDGVPWSTGLYFWTRSSTMLARSDRNEAGGSLIHWWWIARVVQVFLANQNRCKALFTAIKEFITSR